MVMMDVIYQAIHVNDIKSGKKSAREKNNSPKAQEMHSDVAAPPD